MRVLLEKREQYAIHVAFNDFASDTYHWYRFFQDALADFNDRCETCTDCDFLELIAFYDNDKGLVLMDYEP